MKDNNPIPLENPFDQVYQYWRAVKDRIAHCHFPENFNVPITRIVAFSQIPGDDYIAEEIKKIAPNKIHLLFKDALVRNKKFREFYNDTIYLKEVLLILYIYFTSD